MRIKDIFLESYFEDDLTQSILDVLIMYRANEVPQTSIENILVELKKRGFNATFDDVRGILEKHDYEVNGNVITIDVEEEQEELNLDEPEGEGYNPAAQKAKAATRKRM